MTQRAAERLYTAQEFEKLPEFNERYELIHGRLVEKPMPRFEHGDIAENILVAVRLHDPKRQLGKMAPEVSVEIGPDYTPAPDLSFWVSDRVPSRKVDTAPRPDLAIEIQSKGQGTKELYQKARDYLRAGVRLVWIIEPNKKIVAVFRQGQTTPITIQPTGELTGEDVIPGFKIALKDLFPEV